jgi:hypothetical protein
MSVAALNRQYGKPLINGLNPEWLGTRDQGRRASRRTAAFLPQVHNGMHSNPHVAWNLDRFIVYLWIRNWTW